MKIKNSRLEAIRLILSTHEISNQDELLKELNKEGYILTQATLSRDLRQLRVVKTVGTNGRYKYVLTRQQQYRHDGAQGEMRPITPHNEDNGFVSKTQNLANGAVHPFPQIIALLGKESRIGKHGF